MFEIYVLMTRTSMPGPISKVYVPSLFYETAYTQAIDEFSLWPLSLLVHVLIVTQHKLAEVPAR